MQIKTFKDKNLYHEPRTTEEVYCVTGLHVGFLSFEASLFL